MAESTLLGAFIDYLKGNWAAHSQVDQRLGRLHQLICKVRAVTDTAEAAAVRNSSITAWLRMLRSQATRGQEVLDAAAVAGSARRFATGLRALFVCSAEVDRLTTAVEELERLAGPGGDLDTIVRLLSLDSAARAAAPATDERMDVDGRWAPAAAPGGSRHWGQGGSGSSCGCAAGSVAASAKRKRACSCCCCSCGGGGGEVEVEVDAVQPQKRRLLAWLRSRHWSPPGCGGASSSSSAPPPPPPFRRSYRARRVALAMARIRGRAGKTMTTTTRRRRESDLGQTFSRISL